MGGPVKAKHDIYIIKVGDEYRVRPAVMGIERPNKLSIRNATDEDVLLVFPTGVFDVDTQTLLATSSAGSKHFTLGVKGAKKEVYTYHVFAKVGDQLIPVKGESEPILIVDQ